MSTIRDKLARLKAQQAGEDSPLHGTPPGPLQIGGALGAAGGLGYAGYKIGKPLARAAGTAGGKVAGKIAAKFLARRIADAVPFGRAALDVAEAAHETLSRDTPAEATTTVPASPQKPPYQLMTQEEDPRVQAMKDWRQSKQARVLAGKSGARLTPEESAAVRQALTIAQPPTAEPKATAEGAKPQAPQRGVSKRVIAGRQAQLNPEAIQQELIRRNLAIREAEAAGRPEIAQKIRGGSMRAMPGSEYLGLAPNVLMGAQSGLMDLLQHQPINLMHLLGLPTLDEANQAVPSPFPTPPPGWKRSTGA